MPTASQLSFISGDVHRGVVGIVSGIAGLSSEIKQAKKEKHARNSASGGSQLGGETDRDAKRDIPELDGTAVSVDDADLQRPVKEMTVVVRETSTPISTVDSRPSNPLPMPVIIPQRRPGEKRKGFAKAYAPVLENAAITQDIWLKFLEDFDDSSQASSILTVVQLGAVVAGFVPDVIAQAVAAAVQTAAEISIELQMRKRTNTFLHEMNEYFFMKRGLYVMIMMYKPDADPRKRDALESVLTGGIKIEKVDLHDNPDLEEAKMSEREAVAEVQGPPQPEGIPEKDPKGFRLGVGKTHGALQLPQSAPLIFPDQTMQAEDAKGFKAKMSRKREFMSSYLDRRAHMHYANKDPESALVVPEEQRQMKSKWADPNSKTPIGMGMGDRLLGAGKDEDPAGSEVTMATMPGQDLIKGVLRQTYLYLMVVNLPSEEELARARKQLKSQK